MELFEARKKEYLDELRSKIYLLDRINFKDNPELEQKGMELLLDPKTDKDLQAASIVFKLLYDTADLEDRSYNGNVKEIPLTENIGVNLLVEIINALKKDENTAPIFEKTRKNAAKALYGISVAYMNGLADTIEYIAQKCGYNIYDRLDLMQLKLYLDKAINLAKAEDPTTSHINILQVEKLDDLYNFYNEFHQLCEEGKLEMGKIYKKRSNN